MGHLNDLQTEYWPLVELIMCFLKTVGSNQGKTKA